MQRLGVWRHPSRAVAFAVAATVSLAITTVAALSDGAVSWRLAAGPSGATATGVAGDSLPQDPALVSGTLPNGLTYYIRANKTPAKRASLWLAVNAGSVQEDDDQQGFAHFLEHMAFNGTTHFPRHELVGNLQLMGMRFGADINAYTSYDETVYMLEVPTDDPKFVPQGLTMLEDWAGGGILIDSAEVVAERGVVLGEWRSRAPDTASTNLQQYIDSVLYGGESRYRTRYPIGLTALIASAQPAPLRRFYQDWYRPDLMAVIAVGDLDPKQMEREIKARFGKIPAAKQPRPRVSPRMESHAEPKIAIHRAQVSPLINVVWKQPTRHVRTRADFRATLVDQVLMATVQRRYVQLARQPKRPFFGAGFGRTGFASRDVEAYSVAVSAWPTDSLEDGLRIALGEIERIAQHAVPAAALARQKAAILRRIEDAAANERALPSQALVQAYAQHYLRRSGPVLTPKQELALAREILPTITPRDIAQAATFWRTRSNRLTVVQFPKFGSARVPTEQGLAAIFDSVARTTFPADSAATFADAPLMATLPTPGRIVAERRHAAADVTEWTLSNGARVLFKPTRANANELYVRAVSPGGSSLLPDTLFFGPGRLVAEMMTQAAGIGNLDRAALEEKASLTGLSAFQVELTPTREGMLLGGSPRDLEMIFQMLHQQFVAPKLDTAAVGVWRRTGGAKGFGMMDQIDLALAGGNPRLLPASRALMELADSASAMAVYQHRFGNAGDFTFIVTGAATAKEVRPLVERYVASLPSTDVRETPADLDVHRWRGISRSTQRAYEVPRATSILLFDNEFPTAPADYLRERRRLDALNWTLQLRFTDALREQMGGTYGTGVSAQTYALPQEHVRLMINFDAAPERMSGMLDTVFVLLDSVRAHGASAQELRKIAAMQRRAREVALADNGYWLSTIELFDRLKIPLDQIVAPPAAPLTPADVAAAAKAYMPGNAYLHLVWMPRDTMTWRRRDSTVSASAELARKRW